MTRDEVSRVLESLRGTPWIVASLLHGAGLRLLECLQLRVQDIDFESSQITVRDGKGEKDRVTVLPQILKPPLRGHLEDVQRLHARDLSDGFGAVLLPYALERKYPNAAKEWRWQFVFPQDHRLRLAAELSETFVELVLKARKTLGAQAIARELLGDLHHTRPLSPDKASSIIASIGGPFSLTSFRWPCRPTAGRSTNGVEREDFFVIWRLISIVSNCPIKL